MLYFVGSIFDSLGLGWQQILFYLLNLVVLVAILTLVLFKPVKKLISERKKKNAEIFAENERLKSESETLKSKYDELIKQTKIESARLATEVAEKARIHSDEIIAQATEQAEKIIETAKRDAATERERIKTEYRNSVGSLAVEIARKILEREVASRDNSLLIEQVLSDWEND